jgi:hypothetical protein
MKWSLIWNKFNKHVSVHWYIRKCTKIAFSYHLANDIQNTHPRSTHTHSQSLLYKDSHYEILLIQTFIIKCIPSIWFIIWNHLNKIEHVLMKMQTKDAALQDKCLFSHCCLQGIFLLKNFVCIFYSICNNLICFCCVYVSFQAIKLFISNFFSHLGM